MTEPQSWVVIGVFASAILGILSWQTIHIHRSITLLADRLDATIGGFRDTTDLKFDALGSKIDGLDRDVQALTRHVFGTDPR